MCIDIVQIRFDCVWNRPIAAIGIVNAYIKLILCMSFTVFNHLLQFLLV